MSTRFIGLLLVLAFFVAPASSSPAAEPANDWPQHLGPARNGISPEKGLIDQWPEGGAKELWRAKAGVGMSAVVVSRGVALTTANRGSRQKLIAYDAATGAVKWEAELGAPYRNQMGDGPRATPTVAGDRVFAYTGEGHLHAINFADGKPLWSRKVVEDLKGDPAEYGVASSPLVAGDVVVVVAGAPKATVAAFDVGNGSTRWTAGEDPAGYSSPALLKAGGRDQIVVAAGTAVLSIDPARGTVLWRHPWPTNFNCNTATPIAVKDQVFISSGENHGSVMLAVKPDGDKLAVSKVWDSLGPKSVLRSEWQTPILLEDHLYAFDNVGSAGPTSHLTCIEAATGKRTWQQAKFGKGNFIWADGKFFIVTYDGELVVAKASPAGYEELGRKPVVGKTRQTPTLSDGRLYLRDDEDVVCLDVRKL